MTLKLDTPLHAWVYLNRVADGPSRALSALVAELGPERVAHGVFHRADWLGRVRDETAARRDWLRQDEDIAAAEAVGARLLTPQDPGWPTAAFDSAFGFYQAGLGQAPASFDSEAAPPLCLWVRGEDLSGLAGQAVAIVGTRAQSRYGHEATGQLVRGLTAHQWVVVSGGALGIDTAAHAAALESAGKTIAVAACGIDVNYPARNAGLFDAIAAQGAVVSEYAPGTTPQRHRFLTRNRLTAALSQGVVCVEAAFRSGALNTLNWAEALGRVAMAVPGPITSAGSVGCHQRIQQGRAQLVASADEVRELVDAVGRVDAAGQMELDFAPSATQRMSRNELRVFGSMPAADAASARDIAQEAGLRLALVIHILVALEKQGHVARSGALWRRVAEA